MNYLIHLVSSRLISIRLRAAPFNITIIQVYAPTSGHDDSEVDHFYQKLQETIDQTPKKDILVVQGDWNAKVGKDAQADWGEVCGPYCNVETNERGLRLLEFATFVTNEEVRRKIQAAIGEYDELLTLVKKRKLRWFGHVSRSSGLAKTILQGTVKGKRKRGRQKKRWEDNIKEWTGMDFASSTRAAENRSRWKGIVANSSVVPRRPSKVMG